MRTRNVETSWKKHRWNVMHRRWRCINVTCRLDSLLVSLSEATLWPIYAEWTLLPQLFGQVDFIYRSVWSAFLLLPCFIGVCELNANSLDPDQTPRAFCVPFIVCLPPYYASLMMFIGLCLLVIMTPVLFVLENDLPNRKIRSFSTLRVRIYSEKSAVALLINFHCGTGAYFSQ